MERKEINIPLPPGTEVLTTPRSIEERYMEALRNYERLRDKCIVDERDIQQTLGKALGYPWFKDDQTNFPGATETDGVCVGEHVAATLATEAAKAIVDLTTALRLAEARATEGA